MSLILLTFDDTHMLELQHAEDTWTVHLYMQTNVRFTVQGKHWFIYCSGQPGSYIYLTQPLLIITNTTTNNNTNNTFISYQKNRVKYAVLLRTSN